ncbi:hypothetical protein, partial [Mycolicibacterium insubricum]|uniref:hypothetical protein n=1 Tax=Mycolicibacterium insubricum TaxID=444597 RepID=UPI003908AD21
MSSGNITAPLVSGAPLSLDATIPCTAVADPARRRGLVAVHQPAGPASNAGRNGLFIRATDVNITDRNVPVASVPRRTVLSAAPTTRLLRI